MKYLKNGRKEEKERERGKKRGRQKRKASQEHGMRQEISPSGNKRLSSLKKSNHTLGGKDTQSLIKYII